MNLLKIAGCPNCRTENASEILFKDEFRKYRKLVFISRYGKDTDLFQCNECKTKYINVGQGKLYHKLSIKSEELFFKFFDKENIFSKRVKEVLEKIGTPPGIFEYPVQLKTKNKQVYEYSVIRFLESVWPISLNINSMHFVSEIDEVMPSNEAMTLQQRKTAYEAPEIQMGSSPIWLKKNEIIYMTQYSQYFIPKAYGKPEDFSIELEINKPKPVFSSVPIVYFIGPVNV